MNLLTVILDSNFNLTLTQKKNEKKLAGSIKSYVTLGKYAGIPDFHKLTDFSHFITSD